MVSIYEFRYIHTIDDILPYIEGKDEFRVIDKGTYKVINYMVAFEDTFADPWVQYKCECRGLIFDKDGILISRPYHKFFNVGEKPWTQIEKINMYESHVVLEKLDGSMIRPVVIDGKFRLASKAGITEISEQAEQFIRDKKHYTQFCTFCLDYAITPIFEWCSRKNRIVIDYPEDRLVLTALRWNDSGRYIPFDQMREMAEIHNIDCVKALDSCDLAKQNIDLFVKQVKEWEDSEGVVLRFDTGHMVKVKADDYIRRHKSRDLMAVERHVIDLVVNDNIDDVIPVLDDNDVKRLRTFQKSFWSNFDDTQKVIETMYEAGQDIDDQKEFAVEFVQKKVVKQYQPYMYAARRGRDIRAMMQESIRSSLSSQTKVDDARWLWGGLHWNSEVHAGD